MFDELGEPIATRLSRAPTEPLDRIRRTLAAERSWAALDELRTLAARGSAVAEYWLGLLYEHGGGLVPRSAASASRWYRLAARQGEWLALLRLGHLRLREPAIGAAADAELVDRLRRTIVQQAAQGDAAALAWLGDHFHLGLGGTPDPASAERWYTRAAAQGHAGTLTMLAHLIRSRSEATVQERERAFGYVLQAGDAGDASAQHQVGLHYRDGLGGIVDGEIAERWFRAAALQGHGAALRCLTRLEAARVPPPDPGTIRIDTCAGGAGTERLREGWGDLGVAATWTVGPRAVLELPVAEAAEHLLTVAIAEIFPPTGDAFQRIVAEVNGGTVGGVVARGRASFDFFVPAATLAGRDSAEIALGLPDARAASTRGAAGDDRFLGLRVVSIAWQRVAAPVVAPHPDAEFSAHQEALSTMESLGVNCEFGFLQRSVGAEPLGLLRWAFAPLDRLVPALEAGFAEDPERERLHFEIDDAGEFVVEDALYGLRFHSLVYATKGGTLEQLKRAERVRIGMLTRGLIDALREGRKLWVYHDADQSSLEQIRRLVVALNRTGDNTLLWIVGERPDLPAGSVRALEPNLLQGAVTGFQLPVDRVLPQSAHRASWLEVALRAYRLWREPTACASVATVS